MSVRLDDEQLAGIHSNVQEACYGVLQAVRSEARRVTAGQGEELRSAQQRLLALEQRVCAAEAKADSALAWHRRLVVACAVGAAACTVVPALLRLCSSVDAREQAEEGGSSCPHGPHAVQGQGGDARPKGGAVRPAAAGEAPQRTEGWVEVKVRKE